MFGQWADHTIIIILPWGREEQELFFINIQTKLGRVLYLFILDHLFAYYFTNGK